MREQDGFMKDEYEVANEDRPILMSGRMARRLVKPQPGIRFFQGKGGSR